MTIEERAEKASELKAAGQCNCRHFKKYVEGFSGKLRSYYL